MTITTYQSATGWNNAGALADITPQPACPSGIYYDTHEYCGDGMVEPDGYALSELVYSDALLESELTTINTALGVASSASAKMTLTLPKDDRSFGTYNVIVVAPKRKSYRNWYSATVYEIRHIEEITP